MTLTGPEDWVTYCHWRCDLFRSEGLWDAEGFCRSCLSWGVTTSASMDKVSCVRCCFNFLQRLKIHSKFHCLNSLLNFCNAKPTRLKFWQLYLKSKHRIISFLNEISLFNSHLSCCSFKAMEITGRSLCASDWNLFCCQGAKIVCDDCNRSCG